MSSVYEAILEGELLIARSEIRVLLTVIEKERKEKDDFYNSAMPMIDNIEKNLTEKVNDMKVWRDADEEPKEEGYYIVLVVSSYKFNLGVHLAKYIPGHGWAIGTASLLTWAKIPVADIGELM